MHQSGEMRNVFIRQVLEQLKVIAQKDKDKDKINVMNEIKTTYHLSLLPILSSIALPPVAKALAQEQRRRNALITNVD